MGTIGAVTSIHDMIRPQGIDIAGTGDIDIKVRQRLHFRPHGIKVGEGRMGQNEVDRRVLLCESKHWIAVAEAHVDEERDLAEQTGLSKTNIHSGIKDLEQKGFLRVQSKSGVYVEDYMTHGNLDTLVALVNGSSGLLSQDLVSSLSDLFLIVEEFAMLRIAEQPSEKKNRILNARVDAVGTYFAAHPNDTTGKAQEISLFYKEIASLCGSPALPFLWNTMYECVIRIWERCVEIVPDSSLIDVMNRVTERLQAGDGPGAVEIQRWGAGRFLERIRSA